MTGKPGTPKESEERKLPENSLLVIKKNAYLLQNNHQK